MSQSQVVSFRASGHFLNWIESQKLEGESVSQAAQRILKEVSGVHDTHKLYVSTHDSLSTPSTTLSTLSTDLSTNVEAVSTSNIQSVMSTNIVDSVDNLVSERIDPVMERMAAIEERLGKLRA
jgi:archaellum component FlaC